MADDVEFLRACWILDRGSDPSFKMPPGYDFPEKYLRAGIADEGRIWPWELETLLVEAFATAKRPGRRSANPRAWNFWAELVSALRGAENAEGGNQPRAPIFRQLNRILYRQIQWQSRQQNLADIVRWRSIFLDPELNDIYRTRNGIEPLKFQMIGLGFNQVLQERWHSTITSGNISEKISHDDMEIFANIASQSIDEFREECRNIAAVSSLAYRESPLRKAPLIRIGSNPTKIMRPLSQLLFWRITEGMYYDVIGVPSSRNLIGKGFEMYQRRLLAAAYPHTQISGDQPYGPDRHNKRSPDVIVLEKNTIRIAFECKAKKIPLLDKISTDHDILQSVAINEIAKGVFQLARFRSDLRAGTAGNIKEDSNSQYVVLTLDDWNFTGPTTKDAVFAKANELLSRKSVNIDFDLRDIVFCTAADLDLMVTRLDVDRLSSVFMKNRQPEYRDYAPSALAKEFYTKPAKWRDYPLAAEFQFEA